MAFLISFSCLDLSVSAFQRFSFQLFFSASVTGFTTPRGSYQNEISLLKNWLVQRLNFMDTNFVAPPEHGRRHLETAFGEARGGGGAALVRAELAELLARLRVNKASALILFNQINRNERSAAVAKGVRLNHPLVVEPLEGLPR